MEVGRVEWSGRVGRVGAGWEGEGTRSGTRWEGVDGGGGGVSGDDFDLGPGGDGGQRRDSCAWCRYEGCCAEWEL
jgi:hypothetical protein